jgi:hypothetical protein
MRYFIDIRANGVLVDDPEGAEFCDLAAAREEAVQSLRDFVAEQLRQGSFIRKGWTSQLRSESGEIVFAASAMDLILEEPEVRSWVER